MKNHTQNKESQSVRWSLMGHLPTVVWISGLPGSGKTTIAHQLESRLLSMGIFAMALDEELVDKRLDTSAKARNLAEKASLLFEAGMVVIVSSCTPRRVDRLSARVGFPQGLFHEVHLDVPELICEERDLSGRYEEFREGVSTELEGISTAYESHSKPECVLDGVSLDAEECVEELVRVLTDGGVLDRRLKERSLEDFPAVSELE